MKRMKRMFGLAIWICWMGVTGYAQGIDVEAEAVFSQVSAGAAAVTEKEKTEEGKRFDLGAVRSDSTREWTLVLYMDGDNNLEPMALKDFNEMEQGIEGPMEIIVLLDRSKGYDRSDGDWTGARIYRVRKDSDSQHMHSELLADPGELNLGDPEVLRDFLAEALRVFPARHHALILWDHGGGWKLHAIDKDAPGSAKGTDFLTLPELHKAIEEALKRAGVQRLDLVGFDMCQMGQMETAVELKGLADIMVASEANEPGDGWPYLTVLPEFTKGTQGTRRIAESIVRHYGDFYLQRGEPAYTLSALDLERVGPVQKAFDRLADAMGETLSRDWVPVARSIFFSEGYDSRFYLQRDRNSFASVDLMDMFKRIRLNSRNFAAEREYETLKREMDRFVLASTTSELKKQSNGVAIYAPVSRQVYNSLYDKTRLAQTGRWKATLEKLYRQEVLHKTPPKFRELKLVEVSGGKPREVSRAMPLGTQGISCTVEGRNLLWIRAGFGEKVPGSDITKLYLKSVVMDLDWKKRLNAASAEERDYLVPKYKDGVNTQFILYQGYHLKVSNGNKEAYATVSLPMDSKKEMTVVPIVYDDPKLGPLRGLVKFDNKTEVARAVMLYIPLKDGTKIPQQVKPSADTTFTLLFETVDAKGKHGLLRGETMRWGKGWNLTVDIDGPGSYEMVLTAEAIGTKPVSARYAFRVVENPLIKNFSKTASRFGFDDLYGEWRAIDSDAFFSKQKVKPLDETLKISPHPKYGDMFVEERHIGRKPERIILSAGWMERGKAAFLRMLPVDGRNLLPDDRHRQDYLTLLIRIPGSTTLMFRIDLATHTPTLYMKTAGKSGGHAAANGTPPTNSPGNAVPSAAPAQAAQLEGDWVNANGELLQLSRGSYRISDGGKVVDEGRYRIEGEFLILSSGGHGDFRLRWSIRGNSLKLQGADGTLYLYSRHAGGNGTSSVSPAATQQQVPATSENARLRGKFCTYHGGSGAGYYSGSNWAAFDGRGNFSYGSSSFSSGSAGSVYTQGAVHRGSYRVQGNVIHLSYPDGSSDRATVYRQRNDGTITEIRYGSDLYSPRLCD